MNALRIFIPIVIGVALLSVLVVSMTSANGPIVRETNLTPAGSASELNVDSRGNLWISDWKVDEIWQLNPTTGVYTIYHGLNAASDARMDASGDVWWTDFDRNLLGRLSVSANAVTTWTLPGSDIPLGIAFDDAGQVWVTDNLVPRVYRFNPVSHQVCTYTYGMFGGSIYVVWHAGNIWLGDWIGYRLLKLDPSTDTFTIWQPFGTEPKGVDVDKSGNLWWADTGSGFAALTRLEPGSSQLTKYRLPTGSKPAMIHISGESVWYTEYATDTVGVLNPTVASGFTSTLVTTTLPVTPSCSDLGAGISSQVTISTSTVSWAPTTYTLVVNSDGWTVYQLPKSSTGGPWGITVSGGRVWIVDGGSRQKLVWLRYYDYVVYLPVVLK